MSDVQNNWSVRKINVGRITGLSSYELAVKYGFIGTEEDYVNKEAAIYNRMVALIADIHGFDTIKCGDKELRGRDGKTINIETDDCVKVDLDYETNTISIGLKDEFKSSLAYIRQYVTEEE